MTNSTEPSATSGVRNNIVGGLRLAWATSPRDLLMLLVATPIQGLVPPASVWFLKRLIDLIVVGAKTGVRPPGLMATVAALALLNVGERTFNTLLAFKRDMFGVRVEIKAERRFVEGAASADLGHFDSSDWHDRVARGVEGMRNRPYVLAISLIRIPRLIFTLAGLGGLMLWLHPLLLLAVVVSVVPSYFIRRGVTQKQYELWSARTPEQREKDYLRELLTHPRTTKEIRASSLQGYLLSRHQRIRRSLYLQERRIEVMAVLYTLAAGLLASAGFAFSYGFVAVKGVTGQLSPGTLALVVAGFLLVSENVGNLMHSFVEVNLHGVFLKDYFEVLTMKPLVQVSDSPVPLPPPLAKGISFESVDFVYPRSESPVLKGITLHVRPGELLALVGENGAGKSTLVKLLLRFYDPSAGRVLVGGVDLRDADPHELRSRIGVLFQDYATYELTVRDSIILGRPELEVNDDKIREALVKARADRLVDRLPSGLDSRIGRLFEGGHDLSGGEWQRLALARLMYRDADIWVLDEPTSNLDPEAEAAIFAELKENLRGRIGLVISHRFSTVRIADRIAVMEGGRIEELGTHEELVQAGGRYARLFELQAAGYR